MGKIAILSRRSTLVLLCLLAMVLVSCAGSKSKRPNTKDGGEGGVTGMREDFDPEALNDDDIKIEEPKENGATSSDILKNTETALTDTIGNGYRIQIIQTSDPDIARDTQRDALLRFDAEVYRIFDPPFYKVRVGDFVNWTDAENLQKLAVQKGFSDAWVVRTKVNLKRAYRWMSDDF